MSLADLFIEKYMLLFSLCFNPLVQNVLNIKSLTKRHSHSHTHAHSRILSLHIMRCLTLFKWSVCLLVELFFLSYLSPISITDPSAFDACIWVIWTPAVVSIVLIVIPCEDILYASARSLHHAGELLQPAAWQTLITAGASLDQNNGKLNILRGRIPAL